MKTLKKMELKRLESLNSIGFRHSDVPGGDSRQELFLATLALNLNIYWVIFLSSNYTKINDGNVENLAKSVITTNSVVLVLSFIYFKAAAYKRA